MRVILDFSVSVSQNNELVYSAVLRRFLLNAQQRNAENYSTPKDFTVCLLNGTQVQVKVSFDDSSENVLQVSRCTVAIN